MRYQPVHAAKSGSVPFMLRGPKSVRTMLSAAVAGVIGLVPAVMVASPAEAAIPGYTFQSTSVSATEGQPLVFNIVRTGVAPLAAETLTWTATPSGPNAADLDDFTPASGSVNFPLGDGSTTTQTLPITISTTDDSMDEESETFTVTATLGADTITATGTITDNDDAPTYTLQLDDSSPGEAAGTVTVRAELSATSGKAISIPVTSADVTAKAGQDYVAIPANTTLDIAPGQPQSAPLTIAITDDPLYEEAEQSFTITGGASATVTGTRTATVTISDNEDQPEVTIDPATADEGDPLKFPVRLSGPSERAVTVAASTADGPGSDLDSTTAASHGTAKAGEDYTAVTNATVTFPATTVNANIPNGSTQQNFTVSTTADSTDEVDPEDLHATISAPTIAALGTKTVATGGITDDDDSPTVSLLPSTRRVPEGNSGKVAQTFTVKLNKASGQTVSVNYLTAGDSAWDGADFTATSGTLTFAPGETTKTFTVDIIGDTVYEGNEAFDLTLSSSTATVPAPLAPVSIQITDDDAKPTVTVGSVTMAEGNGGSVAVFPIKLSNAASSNVEFAVQDIQGTATTSVSANPLPGVLDYVEPAATAIVPAGQTTGYVYFLVNGDDVYELTESMQVQLTPSSSNVAADVRTATLTITNDDEAPTIEVVSAKANEGDKVQVRAITNGVAQDQSLFSVTFQGASVKGTVAASPADFVNPGVVPVYVSGGTPSGASVDVGNPLEIVDDTTSEGPETILASGTAFGAGKVIDGVVTIAASDGGTDAPAPTLTSSASYRLGVGSLRLNGTAAAGATVTLWGSPIGAPEDKAWESLGTTTANDTGAYSFFPKFTTTGWHFRTTVGEQQSNAITVYLKEDPDFYARSSSRGTAVLSVFGDPRVAGLSVRILRANSNGTWSTVGLGQLDANGKYVRTLTGLRSGASYLYKATVYGDGDVGLMTNTSKSLRIRIR
ncbi:hypothetical protein Asp14428_66560 [Actinoplanes sp. NBRC 14428]|nr:hypothetical protein Asp14428_66560 [Actinoplanes sp. NBRC 14428]